MAHFPSTFHVKPDLSRGEIRLSIQMSEARVDEWWVSGADVREVLALDGTEGWRGEGALRVRFNRGTADVAIYDQGGKRTTIRAFPSSVKLLLAQLRAAVSDLPDRPTEERVVIRDASPDEGIIRAAVRSALQDEIGSMRAGIIDAVKVELGRIEKLIGEIEVAPVVSVSGPTPDAVAPAGVPVFIPSTVGKGAGDGSIASQAKKKKSGGVSDAAKALKARKGRKKK